MLCIFFKNYKRKILKKFSFIILYLLCQLSAVAQWNTDRIMDMGQNALYFSDYVISIQYFNQVIAIKPHLAEPYLLRANAKYYLGDYEGAIQDCSAAIERNPFIPRAYYIRGFLKIQNQDYDQATFDFSKALEFSPNDTTFLRMRIESQERGKNFIGALKDADQILKINPKSYGLFYDKGRLLLQLKDTLGAEKFLNKFIELENKSSMGWSARALLKMQKNDKDGALKDYNEAIKRKSKYAGDYINRGILNNDKKNFKQALSDYDTAIKLDSTESLGYYNRGFLRGFLGDTNNALLDFSKVVTMDSANMEARLKKAMLEFMVGKYKNAIADYKVILKKYSFYIPAYQGIAECEEKLGNEKSAFKYRQMAQNIETNKEYYKRKAKEIIKAENKIVNENQKADVGKKRSLFNQNAVENIEKSEPTPENGNLLWGNVQKKYADITTEGNFVISHITLIDKLRRTNLYHPLLEAYNKKNYPSSLRISNREIPINSDLIGAYFDAIKRTTDSISKIAPTADVYYARALQFASVEDFIGAIDDLDKAISLQPDFMIAYFTRANIRYRLLDYKKNVRKKTIENDDLNMLSAKIPQLDNKNYGFQMDMILSDLDKAAIISPDFAFTYYNKANILSTNKDFKSAIALYTKTIEIDKDFAEAYFNRGLLYLFIGEDSKGLNDLSKAGELGIIKAYNLIQRFKN